MHMICIYAYLSILFDVCAYFLDLYIYLYIYIYLLIYIYIIYIYIRTHALPLIASTCLYPKLLPGFQEAVAKWQQMRQLEVDFGPRKSKRGSPSFDRTGRLVPHGAGHGWVWCLAVACSLIYQ